MAKTIKLYENINKSRLELVKRCENLYDTENEGDKKWLEKFKKTLENYKEEVKYKQKNGSGRYFANGLQSFPREVRKYVCDGYYVDIDIENCHPVIIENLMKHFNIEIPKFLKMYILDRKEAISKYKLKDKLSIIKIINSEKINYKDEDIVNFHDILYNKLVPILQQKYSYMNDNSKYNKLGKFIAKCLQNVENDILMVMYEECRKIKVDVGALVFDGMMISKETYNDNLLDILEKKVYEKLKYNIRLVEKSMNTEWVPIINNDKSIDKEDTYEIIENDYKKLIKNNFDDEVSNISYDNNLIRSDVNNMLIKKMICECKVPEHKYNLIDSGIGCSCIKCGGSFPREGLIPVPISSNYQNLIKYFNVNLTVNNNNIIYQDNPVDLEYQIDENIFKDAEITNLINQSLDGHKISEISKLLRKLYPDFVYEGCWYSFEDYMWNKDDDELSLKRKVLELKNVFAKVKTFYNNKKTIESSASIIKNIKSLEQKLSKPGFKDEIIKESKIFYNERGFISKLNSKKHLIPFRNGVFDLIKNEFRKSDKDDYINLHCDFEYNTNVKNEEVYKFIDEVLPNKNVREFVLKKMSECLNGDIPNTYFMMFIGDTGANGKSQLLNLMKLTMGDFGEKVEVTLLTRKRSNANESNTEKIKLMNKRFAFLYRIVKGTYWFRGNCCQRIISRCYVICYGGKIIFSMQ